MTEPRKVLAELFARNDGDVEIIDELAAAIATEATAAAEQRLRERETPECFESGLLAAWRRTKDFLADRLITSGRSDVSVNAVLRVMNGAFDEPPPPASPRQGEPVEGLDVERLALAIAGEPDDLGLGCSETVERARMFGRSVEACGREAYAYVRPVWQDDDGEGDPLCKLHTTLAVKKGGRQTRPVVELDQRAAEQDRWHARMAKARGSAARYAAAYAALSEPAEAGEPVRAALAAEE